MVIKPSSSTLISIPLRIGMVVLEVTAFDTMFKALTKVFCEQENLIFVPPLVNYNLIR